MGGIRSGKTTSATYWLVRQWILKGGRGARFWWVSPSRGQTRIGVEKLVLGETSDRYQPPALPMDSDGIPFLAVGWPESDGTRKQRITMVDGSVIELQHASKPSGGNLKGRSVRAILLDEACEVAHRPNWTVLLGRLMDSGGQLFFATTPRGGHWIKEETVDQMPVNKDIRVESLSSRENPWMSKEDLERTIAACKDENEVRREIDGMFVGDLGSLWIHWDPKRHTYDGPTFDLPKDRQDVTAQAIRGFWRSGGNQFLRTMVPQNTNFIGGQDFNFNPMTTVVAKVFGDPQKPETWGVCVVDEVQQWDSDAYKHGSWLKSEKCRNGRVSYAGIPLACDSTSCNYDSTRVKGSSRNQSSSAKELVKLGFDARPCMTSSRGAPVNPYLLDSISLMHQLMREGRILIHGTRCPQLLRALEDQQVRSDGKPEKVSSTASDRLSSPIDALRYLCWALFAPKPKPGKIEVM
nr:terminase family protein [Nannocystis sp. SCPEA4]